MINNLKNYTFLSLFFNLNLLYSSSSFLSDLAINANLFGIYLHNFQIKEKVKKDDFFKKVFRKDNFYEDIKENYLYNKEMIDEYYRNYKKFDLLKNRKEIEILHQRQKFLLEKIQNIILYKEKLNKFFSDKKSISSYGQKISDERNKMSTIYWKYQINNKIFIENLINNRKKL